MKSTSSSRGLGAAWLVIMLLLCSSVQAQPMQGAPSGHAAVGDDPHAGMEGAPAMERRPLANAEASKDVPVGTIRVHVLDANEHPVANAEVQVGTMSQESGRTSLASRSNASGVAEFAKLMTGDKLAYRVNVLHAGAKYSSTPFRLPSDQGYDVVVRQLDTTRDDKEIVLYVGATSVEIKDERLKIVQQARLFNVGHDTYVFPDKGLLVKLPPGVLAFQAEEVMTDQKLKEESGQGFTIHGSLPPGEVTLTWGFDLPREGTTADLSFDMAWPTFAYRVLADAAEGMTLSVDDLPAPELHADNGRRFYVTETMKNPGDTPLRSVHIHLRGIPGPGPMRYIATALAMLMLAAGLVIVRKTRSVPARVFSSKDFAASKAELLARATKLEAEQRGGDIGPEFHASQVAQLEEELAALLYEEARAQRASR